ncbi:hypothetical protein ACOMHN_065488 [Nucella lapillus]
MKMPTAVVRHKVPWKPGDQVPSYPMGEGCSLSPEGETLPAVLVSAGVVRPGVQSPDPRAPPASRDEEMIGAMAAAASLSLSAPASGSWEQAGKRFPILGPTRQDTELYFRRRRSARHKIRTASRPLVTRSAERVVPADFDPSPRLTCTTLTPSLSTSSPIIAPSPISRANTSASIITNNNNNNNHLHLKGFRYVDRKTNFSPSYNNVDSSQEASPDPQIVTTSLPVFQHVSVNLQKSPMAKPASAFVRSGSSPPLDRTTFLTFDRSASFHVGSGLVQNGPRKKYEIPIKFLSESGQIRASELTHRVSKTPGEAPKTLQPSKYGFHRRSKSPTFKRLVAVAEKLQDVVVIPDLSNDSRVLDKSQAARPTSARVARLPAVDGSGDGRGGGGGGEGEEEEDPCVSDEGMTSVPPQDYLSSFPFNMHRQNTKVDTKPKVGNSVVRNSAKRHSLVAPSKNKGLQSSHSTHDVATSTCDADFLTNGWGAWEVDSNGVEGQMLHPDNLPVPLAGLPPSDSQTELHLFLPRLADTASEESGSGIASKTLPERHRPRLPHNSRGSNPARGGKASENHPHTSMRPPQHPHLTGGPAGERSSRSQSKRFTSPVRMLRRDRTPKRRCSGAACSAGEMYESYEPFIKGEHLKEKIEDFPTLISLDQD